MIIYGGTLKGLLEKARTERYAIPHFNYSDVWDFMAIVEAAEEAEAPVIVAAIPRVINGIGRSLCASLGSIGMAGSRVPAVHHLDHATNAEYCFWAIDAGYPSVMIDASMCSLEENIKVTKQVVEYAHKRGVHVEAEIGQVPAGKDAGAELSAGDAPANTATLKDQLVNPEEAAELVKQSGVDSLAIGIGTAHGFYKSTPKIDYERLAKVRSLVDIPLVLHGGTGIPEEAVQRAIREGIAKVNIGTIIRSVYLTNLGEAIKNMDPAEHTVDIQAAIRPKVKAEIKDWIRICMAAGKA